MDNMKHRRLQELDRSDFEIVDGEPDIRGWDIKLANGENIGNVEELIIDAQEKKVRYMVVDLDDNDVGLTKGQRVLIPIGLAELHRKDDDVILPNVAVSHLRELPGYDKHNLTPEVERRICDALGMNSTHETMQANTTQTSTTQNTEAGFYNNDYFNDDRLYHNRLHELDGKRKQESEYENGLRLWEKRSQGGILEDGERERRRESEHEEREVNEEARMEMVRNRRNNYEQKRYGDDYGRSKGRSIEDRIKDEGLRDA